jgi:hypothetical protein
VYRMMNETCDEVLAELDRISDVPRYIELRHRLFASDVAADEDFHAMYRAYWQMNVARLGDPFYFRYFALLESLKRNGVGVQRDINETIRELALISNTTERPSLQFSFATKLLNTIEPRLPVYDSYVSQFYFFVAPPSNYSVDARLSALLAFHGFLRAEYARVIQEGLLAESIDRFRRHFGMGAELCDERVIDMLIWGFVSLLRNGAQLEKRALFR